MPPPLKYWTGSTCLEIGCKPVLLCIQLQNVRYIESDKLGGWPENKKQHFFHISRSHHTSETSVQYLHNLVHWKVNLVPWKSFNDFSSGSEYSSFAWRKKHSCDWQSYFWSRHRQNKWFDIFVLSWFVNVTKNLQCLVKIMIVFFCFGCLIRGLRLNMAV